MIEYLIENWAPLTVAYLVGAGMMVLTRITVIREPKKDNTIKVNLPLVTKTDEELNSRVQYFGQKVEQIISEWYKRNDGDAVIKTRNSVQYDIDTITNLIELAFVRGQIEEDSKVFYLNEIINISLIAHRFLDSKEDNENG